MADVHQINQAMRDEMQIEFLRKGGTALPALIMHRQSGFLKKSYEFEAYPKALHFDLGEREFDCTTMACDKQILRWKETRKISATMLVDSEAEERATLDAYDYAIELGVRVDTDWTAARLRDQVALAAQRVGKPIERPQKARNALAVASAVAPAAVTASEPSFDRLSALENKVSMIADLLLELRAEPTGVAAPKRPHRRTRPQDTGNASAAQTAEASTAANAGDLAA